MSSVDLQDGGLNIRIVLMHMIIGAFSLLAGYAAGYLLLRNILISDSEWAEDVIQNGYLQLLCCLPALLVVSPIPALIPVLLNTKLRLSNSVTYVMSGVFGVSLGIAIFIPSQWLFLLGAAI